MKGLLIFPLTCNCHLLAYSHIRTALLYIIVCCRGQMLEESYAFQQFSANIDEEEAWISEKQRLLSGGDLGDTMAAVQVSYCCDT